MGDEALAAEVPERDEAGDAEEQPAGEAELAPQRHRTALAGERRGAPRVEQAGHHRGEELERLERRRDVAEERHRRRLPWDGVRAVDLHCHILPGGDDGPQTIHESDQ